MVFTSWKFRIIFLPFMTTSVSYFKMETDSGFIILLCFHLWIDLLVLYPDNVLPCIYVCSLQSIVWPLSLSCKCMRLQIQSYKPWWGAWWMMLRGKDAFILFRLSIWIYFLREKSLLLCNQVPLHVVPHVLNSLDKYKIHHLSVMVETF